MPIKQGLVDGEFPRTALSSGDSSTRAHLVRSDYAVQLLGECLPISSLRSVHLMAPRTARMFGVQRVLNVCHAHRVISERATRLHESPARARIHQCRRCTELTDVRVSSDQ